MAGGGASMKPIFYCHIPKTAGTSLRHALEALFPPKSIVPDRFMMSRNGGNYPHAELVKAVLRWQGSAVRMVRGHYPFWLSEWLDDPLTLVVLREPVARAVSHIQQTIRHGFLTEDKARAELDAGRLPVRPNLMTHMLGSSPEKPGDTDVERALHVLQGISCLGLVEDLPAFTERLRRMTGLKIALEPKNVAPAAIDLTGRHLDVISELNALDVRLYERAKAVLADLSTNA